MSVSAQFLNPADAAKRLGVSAKALRLYEERRLVQPNRTEAGWRVYSPAAMAKARDVVALRQLGLSLAQTARVLDGDPLELERALGAHQSTLNARLRDLAATIEKVAALREEIARGQTSPQDLANLFRTGDTAIIGFDLPWPWAGERFELADVRSRNFLIGPLGSGKTRLAQRIAEAWPDALFIGLDRLEFDANALQASVDDDAGLRARIESALDWLIDDGASRSNALVALLQRLEANRARPLVVDMIEQGLDQASQEALIAYLRSHGANRGPLFLLTRSTAILDLPTMTADETIIFCPANHSPPFYVAPHPGARGYESVATCLASPDVSARTEGVIAWRPPAAVRASG